MVSPGTVDDPAKVNYRTMGRGHGGVLKQRHPRFVRDFSRPARSTIPPKFETVLYRHNHEKAGFSQYTPRFAEGQRSEQMPGPGAYAGPGASAAGDGPPNQQAGGSSGSGSAGLRGTSAFATRAPRLPGRGMRVDPPGPGAYEAAAAPPRGSAAAASAAFVMPGSVNPLKIHARPSPGPGDYSDGPQPRSARGPRLPANECNSQMAGGGGYGRLPPSAAEGGPGPGQYDVDSPRAASLPPKGWTIGSSKRRLVPHASEAVEQQPIQNLLKAGAEMIAEKKTPPALPGPGDYSPQDCESQGPRHVSNRGHSCFQAGLSHLPRQWRAPSPGPGDYGQAAAAEASAVPVRASFASASPRFREQVPAAPGPAYYSPRRRGDARCFHLNLKGGWV